MHIAVKILLIAGLVVGVLALGNCHRWHHKRGHHLTPKKVEWIAGKIKSKLDLDESQKAKLDEITNEIIARFPKDPRAKRKEMAAYLADQVRQERIDAAAVKAKLAERKKEMESHFDFMVEKVLEFHAILKPEQKEKLAGYLDKWAGR